MSNAIATAYGAILLPAAQRIPAGNPHSTFQLSLGPVNPIPHLLLFTKYIREGTLADPSKSHSIIYLIHFALDLEDTIRLEGEVVNLPRHTVCTDLGSRTLVLRINEEIRDKALLHLPRFLITLPAYLVHINALC